MRPLVVAVILLGFIGCSSNGRSSGTGNGSDGGTGSMANCPGGADTTVAGTVFAPNGVDPVPNATVYVPATAPAPFPDGVACDLCGTPSGALTSTVTRYDGTFELPDVPAGDSVPIVVELGRFRRVTTMSVTACQNNLVPHDPNVFGLRLPGKDGDLSPDDRVPRIAVATGDYDQIECVLQRMGISQIDLYDDRYQGTLPSTIGNFFDLLNDRQKLESYNLVIINCTYSDFEPKLTPTVLANLEHFVGAGGRLYATDWAYDFIDQVPQFAPYLCFVPGGVDGPSPPTTCATTPGTPGEAHSTTPWSTAANVDDPTLKSWLGVFPQVLTNGQIAVSYNFVVVDHVGDPMMFPTTVWLDGVAMDPSALPQQSKGDRPMTVTFDYQQCGRVHYSTYNTEPMAVPADSQTVRYPSCEMRKDFYPQERLLEYLIFETAQCVGPIG